VVDLKKVFQKATIEAATETLLGPVWRGDFTLDAEFVEDFDAAPVYLFRDLEYLRLGTGRYVIGCDPSNGVPGGAFSGLSVVDLNTGEQVLSGLFSLCDAVKLAGLACELAKILSGDMSRCRIAYECTGGVGAAFTHELRRRRFPESLCLPLHNSSGTGEAWLVEMGRAIRIGDLVLRDRRVVDEFSHFTYDKNGKLGQYGGREGHGDGSIALATAWQYAKEYAARKRQPGRYKTDEVSFDEEVKIKAMKRRNNLPSDRFRLRESYF
jgi:hypothetical protein